MLYYNIVVMQSAWYTHLNKCVLSAGITKRLRVLFYEILCVLSSGVLLVFVVPVATIYRQCNHTHYHHYPKSCQE